MIAERVETPPLLPGVLLKVMQMDPESDAYFDEMVTLIEVVRRHHEHVPSPDASSAVAREPRIVRLADAIAMCVETTPEVVDLEEAADVLRARRRSGTRSWASTKA